MNSIKYYVLNNMISRLPSRRIRWYAYSLVLKYLGSDSSLLMGVTILKPSNISIGKNAVINKGVLLDGRGGNLMIGENVDIAIDTKIWTLEHDINSSTHSTIGGDVIIEKNVWIASGATILPGAVIGEGAVVASGSVVTKNVLPYDVVGGVPAKVIGKRTHNLNYKLNYRPFLR